MSSPQGVGMRTDHLHDLDDEGALVEQAFLFGGVLAVDGVERLLRLLQGGAVLLVLAAGVVGAVLRLLDLLDGEAVVGLAVEPGAQGGLRHIYYYYYYHFYYNCYVDARRGLSAQRHFSEWLFQSSSGDVNSSI